MQPNRKNYFLATIAAIILLFSSELIQAGESSSNENNKIKNPNNDISSSVKKTTSSDNGKVALVNGVAISRELFDIAMTPTLQQISTLGEGAVTPEQMTQIKTRVLENLIANELLYQESQKNGIKVEEKEITDIYNMEKAKFTSEAEFQNRLKEYKISDKDFIGQIKMGLSIQHFIDKQFAVSDEEAKKFYGDNPDKFQQPLRVRASHIMIMMDPNADQAKKDEAKTQIETILKRLNSGEDFAAVAKETSQDPGSKDNGGDLGYFARGDMVKSFEDVAFMLKPGEISNIVETQFGYHVIMVTDKVDARTISFDESKDRIIDYLKNTKVTPYLTAVREKAAVEIFLPQ